VQFSNVVDYDERISMIGAEGIAYVGGNAINVIDWTQMWTSNFEPVMALRNQHVAMHELSTGLLHEVDATGATVASAAFGGRWGYQAAFGLWVSAESGINARVALPLEEAKGAFRFLGGIGSGQNAAQMPIRRSTADEAAAVALDFIFNASRNAGLEAGGRVCQHGSLFERGLIEFGQPTRMAFDLSEETCPDGGMTVGLFHTHWQSYSTASMPSGYRNFLEYHDPEGSDLKTADNNPTLRFYLKSHNQPISNTHILRFQGPNSKNNVWERQSVGTWMKLPNAPWQ
jgi:hypothetical protein